MTNKVVMMYPENAPEVRETEENEKEFHWPIPIAVTYMCTAVWGLTLFFLQGLHVLTSVMDIVHDGYVYAPVEHSMNAYWYATVAVLICELLFLLLGGILLLKIPDWLVRYQKFTTKRIRKAWKRRMPPRKAWKYYLKWNVPAFLLFLLCWHFAAQGRKGGVKA